MKKAIILKIECGETTCAIEPWCFCRFFLAHPVQDGHCQLFGKVYDKNGWIQRHHECIQMAIDDEKRA